MMENTRPDEETAIGGMLSSTSFLDVTNLLPSEVARRFPGLEVLDSEAITQIGFTADSAADSIPVVPKPSAITFPCEMGGPFISGVDGALVSNFLLR